MICHKPCPISPIHSKKGLKITPKVKVFGLDHAIKKSPSLKSSQFTFHQGDGLVDDLPSGIFFAQL